MEKDVSISVLEANLAMFAITVPLTAGLASVFILTWNLQTFIAGFFRFLDLSCLLPVILIGVPLHEMLHAIGWVVFGKKAFSDIQLGFQWKMLTPYAHLKVPINAFGYRMGTLLPGLALGLVPFLIGLATGDGWLCMLGLFFIFAAGGDLLTIWILRKLDASDLVLDHPSRVGCLVVG
jgi:hypothetical protein